MRWSERKSADAVVPEWFDFWHFVRDVGECPSPNHVLVRLRDAPYGPDNFKWQETLRRAKGESKKAWWARKWASRRQNFPLYEADRNLRRKYGITSDQYKEMLKTQGDACAICKKPETSPDGRTGGTKSLAVDHCHETQRIRGLLCKRCNTLLGSVGDSMDLLVQMVLYLERHKDFEQLGYRPG